MDRVRPVAVSFFCCHSLENPTDTDMSCDVTYEVKEGTNIWKYKTWLAIPAHASRAAPLWITAPS